MHLREEIEKEHSKVQCNKIVAWVGDDQRKFDALFLLCIEDDSLVMQRAAWPLSYCVIANPHLIKKHLGKFIKNLQQPNLHDAVKRNTVRIFQEIDIPKKYHGTVMDTCFRYVEDVNEAVAVKAFSLTILGKLSKQYPDIIPEIKLLIAEQMPHQSAAFKSRAKMVLKNMERHQPNII